MEIGGVSWRSQFRPEPTPRAYRGERVTGQAPCYPVLRTMPSVCIHSPVRSVQAPRSGRARVGIQPGRIVPAQRSWPPVRLFGPDYPAPALRTVSPVRQQSPVRPVPAPRTCRAKGVSSQDELGQLCAPPKLTDKAKRALIREATKRPKITMKELQSSTTEIGVSVHRITLSRTPHRAELYGRVARRK